VGICGFFQGPKKTFRLTAGSVETVGYATRADFIVDAALVSRVHCRLTATRDGVEVEDLKSTDGTYVNDKRVKRAWTEHLKNPESAIPWSEVRRKLHD
jgi:pSer/pThr/pTyr-binding forkhead associated (FHA) protein